MPFKFRLLWQVQAFSRSGFLLQSKLHGRHALAPLDMHKSRSSVRATKTLQKATTPHPARLERKEQLDGLRAIAIGLVLYSHFWNLDTALGTEGVYLFFVLSGYLITGVLLRARGKASALTRFYIRRSLRIFPAYYITLGFAWLFNLGAIRGSILWHVCYLSNVWFVRRNDWSYPWTAGHLWSLSVEEQFYLVWPLLVLWLPPKALKPLVWCAIAGSIAFQLVVDPHASSDLTRIHTLSSMDKLGAGALLALCEDDTGLPRWLTKAGWAACLGLVALQGRGSPSNPGMLRTELVVIVSAALIAAASVGITGPGGAFLNAPVVRYVGRISYGIYLLHIFIYGFFDKLFSRVGYTALHHGPKTTAGLIATTLAAAAFLWHFVEQPFNRLKERFE